MSTHLSRRGFGWAICIVVVLVDGAVSRADDKDAKGSAPPTSQPAEVKWNKVESAEDSLRDAYQQRVYQFRISSPAWRISVKTEPIAGGNSSVRLALEVERVRHATTGAPVNWAPFATLFEGRPGGSGTKELANGVHKDGGPKYFRLVVAGVNVRYQIQIEDQPGADRPEPRRKKDK